MHWYQNEYHWTSYDMVAKTIFNHIFKYAYYLKMDV